jgi:hypothetical protein
MPTAARFRTECVAALWDGTRFADVRARARMLADAEAFVGDITADGEYPHELVVDRVTRYRPEGVRVGSVVSGRALLHDMTAFILRLSRRDPLPASLRGGALHAADVARALSVSARTLARFRSDGLVMHHVRDAGGRVRVACFPDALQAFRERAAARVDRAGRTVRMDAEARALLRSRAVELCAAGGRVSLHAIATRLAPVFGCSVRAARGVLEVDAVVVAAVRAAQRVGEPAAQRGSARGTPGSGAGGTQGSGARASGAAACGAASGGGEVVRSPRRIRQFAARAVGFGCPPAALAQWLGMTESTAARAAVRGRVERLRQAMKDVSPVLLPIFVLPDAAGSILAPLAVCAALPVGPVRIPDPARVRGGRAPNRGEVALAVAFRFLVWRAHTALRAISKTPVAREVDAIERDLRWAYRIKRALLERVLPVALLPCVQRLGRGWDEVPVSLRMRWAAFAALECAHALEFGEHSSVAIEDVHPAHVAAHAVERAIARGGPEFAPSNGDDANALEDAIMRCVPWWHVVCAGDGWLSTAAKCAPEHGRVLALHFGLDGTMPRTFEEIARELKISTSRATADWYAAMHAVLQVR